MKKETVKKLVAVYDKYVRLFAEENSDLIGLSIAHGYRGNQEHYKKGVKIRAKIASLKKELGLL